jgi:hypothetical protein
MIIASAKSRSRGAARDVRREGYKGLLYRGLYTILFTTRLFRRMRRIRVVISKRLL